MKTPIPDELLEQMSKRFQMLSDPSRLAILRALMKREHNVGELVESTKLGQANVSKHLRLLSDSGMISRRKEGLKAYYRLEDPVVEKICAITCETLISKNTHSRRTVARRRAK